LESGSVDDSATGRDIARELDEMAHRQDDEPEKQS
jgi:hypothetical protein